MLTMEALLAIAVKVEETTIRQFLPCAKMSMMSATESTNQ